MKINWINIKKLCVLLSLQLLTNQQPSLWCHFYLAPRGSLSSYQLIPIQRQDANGKYIAGHVMIWNPQNVRMVFFISEEALARDHAIISFAPYYKTIGLVQEVKPHPGDSVRELVRKSPGGIAYFNAGEAGALVYPLIQDGKLLTKPEGSRAILQKTWEPLEGVFPFFLQYPDGKVEIRELHVTQNEIAPEDRKYVPKGTHGFSAPYILKRGVHVPLKNPFPGETARSGEVLFPEKSKSPAAISVIGITKVGRIGRVSLIGDIENPEDISRLPTEEYLVTELIRLGFSDVLYSGASGDVQYYDAQSDIFIVAPERAKSEDRRWVLKQGQRERGLPLIIKVQDNNPQPNGDVAHELQVEEALAGAL